MRPAFGLRARTRLFTTLLIGPSMLWVGGSLIFAVILLASISIRDIKLGRLEAIFRAPLTFDTYVAVFNDPATWRSFGVAFLYVLGATAIPFALGLLTALLLNQKMPGQRLLRTLALIPWAVPAVTATIIFTWMMQPSFGVVNFILRTIGLIQEDVNWFANPTTALISVIIPTSWKAYPFFTLLLLAGLQSIPHEMYEASSLDGAGKIAQFRYVTLPSLAPFMLIALIFNAMYTFREFDFIYASTRGGPGGATETTAVRIYNVAFENFNMGAASALGIITFAFVGLLVWLLMRRSYKGSLEGFL